MEADTSGAPIEQKVRNNKPADATDLCLTTPGATDADIVDVGLGTDACPVKFQGSPRQAAGGPLAENIFKCQLKPLNFADPAYGGVTFTSDQQTRLAATFPTGVCDWSKPGVSQVPENPYTTFAAGPGGQPLGDEPESTLGPPVLTALSPARVWIGLKNSDDVGAHFDLKAEVYKDGLSIGGGSLENVPGGGSGFTNAKNDSIPVALTVSPPVDLPSGTTLSIKLSARIACASKTHLSGAARFWYDDMQAASQFGATVDGVPVPYYIRSGSALGSTQGAGPKKSADVALNSKQSCTGTPGRSYTPIGTWSVELP